MSLDERALVVQEAMSWIGTPYHHHGRIKGVGVDCAMLPAEVYHACGLIPHIEVEHYPTDWHMHRSEERYLATVLDHAHEVEDPSPGNFILYKWGRCFAHGGIIIQWPIIVHSFTGVGVAMENGQSGRLEDREFKLYSLWEDGQ